MVLQQDPILAIINHQSNNDRFQVDDLLVRLLSQVQLIEDFTREDISAIIGSLEKIIFLENEYIFHEGDTGDTSVYIIVSGEVVVVKGAMSKSPVEMARLSPGESFGETSLIDRKPRSASIRAVNRCTLLKLKSDALVKRQRLAAKLLLNMSRLMATRLRNSNRKCELFAATPFASGMNDYEIRTFASYLEIRFFLKGDNIMNEDDAESYMCIITEGQVNIVKGNSTNDYKTIATLGRGQSFGEMSLFDGQPRSAAAVASENTSLLVLKREYLCDMVRDMPSIAAKFTVKVGTILSQRLRIMDKKLINFIN